MLLMPPPPPVQLRKFASRPAAKAQVAARGAQGGMLILPQFQKRVAAAAEEEKKRRQSLEAMEGGKPAPAKPLHLLLFPWMDPDHHQEPKPALGNTSRPRTAAQMRQLGLSGGRRLASPEPPAAKDSTAEAGGGGAVVAVEVVALPSTGSETSPPSCSGAGSKEWNAAAKELPPALPQANKQPAAGSETPPAWRRLGCWLLSVFSCDLKWKGVIDKPLIDFERECRPRPTVCICCAELPPLDADSTWCTD